MARKRRRLIPPPEAAEEVDHISHLPDAIIHYIFSFLPFKDVVKTSMLSKQWRFAWTSSPYIDLSLPSKGVVPSISRALSLCTATKIEKFHLDANVISTEIDGWLHFAAARKVEDFSLVFRQWHHFIPRLLWDSSWLVSLRVSKCLFPRNITVHWPSLKKLCLQDHCLKKDQIMKILSGCPVLESLKLRSMSIFACDLQIESTYLRELVIEAVCISSINISAPNLLSLRLWGELTVAGVRLNGVSSLVAAELNFKELDQLKFLVERQQVHLSDQLRILLKQLQDVMTITIGSGCLKVLSTWEVMGMSYLSSSWHNIIVYSTLSKSDLHGIAYLLRSSPLVERLVICIPDFKNVTFKNEDYLDLCDFYEKQYWPSQKEFYCVPNHLKRVEIAGFELDKEKSKLLLALVKFLLEKAVGLEKMILDAELRISYQGLPIDPRDLGDLHDVIQLQEGCRRASRSAEVIVNYHFNGLPHQL
ncbi:hypothetical protein BT93_L2585 [Corymbia citriodora subsp. variegata]|uniref:F-box domain-containing protein n=1 Tax=Corymbia citriodora subsp. variegata TaxID=360336 RepID=A0A8T0CKK0_CORYI|nr:hypothetical protein BT93_L2585 [Corymbia citriodora subsp. variegata]